MITTTTNSPEAWRPNVVVNLDPSNYLDDALIMQTGTYVGSVEGDAPQVLIPYVPDDPEATIVVEGEEIPLADVPTDQVALSTHKIAVVTRVSREMTTQPGAADRIAASLSRSVIRKADNVFLANAADPTGLLNVGDVQTVGDLGADVFDAYDAVAAIEADGGTATHLLVNPLDWGALARIPEATGSNRSVLADVHDAATRTLAGVPVIVHSAVPQGTALMLDRNEVLAAYGTLDLARSDDAFFTQDAVAIRATWRIGFGIVRPSRLVRLTVTEPGA